MKTIKQIFFLSLCSVFMLSCASKPVSQDIFNAGISKKPKEHQITNIFDSKDFFKSDLNTLSSSDNNVILCGQITNDKKNKDKIKLGCTSHHLSFECDINGKDSEECINKFRNTFETENKYY